MLRAELFLEKNKNGSAAPAPRGQALASLDAFDLGEHFYCWRGASGARYVCSVFGRSEEAAVADFSQGLIIGVVRDGALRKPVCMLFASDFDTVHGREIYDAARAHGVCEWHVHFSASEAVFRDLGATLLN